MTDATIQPAVPDVRHCRIWVGFYGTRRSPISRKISGNNLFSPFVILLGGIKPEYKIHEYGLSWSIRPRNFSGDLLRAWADSPLPLRGRWRASILSLRCFNFDIVSPSPWLQLSQ